MKLFENERMKGGAGGQVSTSGQRSFHEMAYWHKAYEMLPDECYKIVFVSQLILIFKCVKMLILICRLLCSAIINFLFEKMKYLGI